MACVSPSARAAVLNHGGFSLGGARFSFRPEALTIQLSSECEVPPIGWWKYCGDIAIDSSNSLRSACNVIETLKSSWDRCRITSVHLCEGEELSHEKQARVFFCLDSIKADIVDLRLTEFSLRDEDTLPFLEDLRCVFLTNCDGPIQKWCSAFGAQLERVEISDTGAFTELSFATMPPHQWQRLVLDNSNVSAANVRQLPCSQTLRTLSLIDCSRVDALDAGMFPELRLLLLGRTPISSDLLTGVDKCKHLNLVNLGGCRDITDVNAFGRLSGLRELFLHDTAVTNAGIRGLSKCECLEKLNLGGCVNVSDVSHLGSLLALKELHLWRTRVTNAGIQGLSSCRSLAELLLDDCVRITDVSALGQLSSLRWLSLIGTEVNTQGVKELIHCDALETLALAGTRIRNPPKLWRHDTIIQYLSAL